jgi:hypothetical protein
MRTLALSIIVLCAAMASATEIEIELSTGSRFKGDLKSVTPRLVVVETAIGELKLKPSMLSPACRRLVAEAARADTPEAPLPDLGVKVDYRVKTLERDKDTRRRGGARELLRRAGVLSVTFETPPRDRVVKGYIEYVFTAEIRSQRDRGEVREFDRGRREFVLDPTEAAQPVEIISEGLTHTERGHTGDTIAERGAEPKGYRVRVVADGQVVHEESK